MKQVWLSCSVVFAGGMLLLSGCEDQKAASAPNSTSLPSSSALVEASKEELASSPSSLVNETEEAVSPGANSSDRITLADMAGFLPSDPIESTELTEDENQYFVNLGMPPKVDGIKPSEFIFEDPIRLKAGDQYISVDAPGYACPTMADVDEDGKLDLVVGQFTKGKMKVFRNIANHSHSTEDKQSHEFATGSWIKTGDVAAEVPGVW